MGRGAGNAGERLLIWVKRSGLVVSFSLFVCTAHEAKAVPLTPFRYQAQAQRHCPGDSVVWLDFRRARYYLKGQKRYGLGLTGSFVCRSEAQASGYRRSLLGLR
ncbi:hypothetical protein GRB70_11715 [Bradyrhizobium neotropicale]|nr:hypothetical protein [Bradyrhizobium neotropicale]